MGANYELKRKITHRLRHGRMSYATEVFARRKVTTTAGQTSCFFLCVLVYAMGHSVDIGERGVVSASFGHFIRSVLSVCF